MLKLIWFSYFLFELIFCVGFVTKIGFLPYVVEVFLSAILGIFIVWQVGFKYIFENAIFSNFKEIFTKFAMIFAGIFLIIPGILSDLVALALILISIKNKTINKKHTQDSDIIDVEIIKEG